MPVRTRVALAACVAAVAAVAGVSPAAAREHRRAPADAARWIAPADGARLTAGERAEFSWEPGPGFARLGAVEEWELFLSLDGGRTWSIRLTPHLDLERTRVAVQLPELVSRDARLLLRVGDERVEHELEIPVRLELGRGAGVRLEHRTPVRHALERGESARAGRRGVVLWAAGDRSGSARRWVWYAGGEALSPARQWRSGHGPQFGSDPKRTSRHLFVPPRLRAAPLDPEAAVARAAPRSAARSAALDPLAAGCRHNE